MSKVLKKSKLRGLAAALRRRGRHHPTVASTLGSVSGLGQLVPISQIVAKVQQQIKAGKTLPGDPLVLDYERWKEGLAKGEIKKGTPPPGELTESEQKLFQDRYVGVLIPDLKDYIPFMFDKVFVKAKDDKGQKYGQGSFRRDKKMEAELLHKYACKRISRLMPGFATVVKKTISDEIDLVGEWDEPISPDAFAKKEKNKKTPPPDPEFKPKPRVVEICTVTHQQLEETLRRDLDKLVAAVRMGSAPADKEDLIPVISHQLLAALWKKRLAMLKSGASGGARRPPPPRGRPPVRAPVRRPPPRRGKPPPRRTTRRKAPPRRGRRPVRRPPTRRRR